MAWLAGWGRRKQITVEGTAAGAQADYQMMVKAYTQDTWEADPATSTSGNGWFSNYMFQRKVFYIAGRFWIFYADGTVCRCRTSVDGYTWSGATSIRASCEYGHRISFWFDGTYIHYAFCQAGAGHYVYYRRGLPECDGSITWSAVEQTVLVVGGGENVMYPTVIVDSAGYPWIGYMIFTGGPNTYPVDCVVTKSSQNDGTWTTDFTTILVAGVTNQFTAPVGCPLASSQRVYWTYVKNTLNDVIYGREWNGGGWDAEEEATISTTTYTRHNVVADGDDVHINFDGIHRKRTDGVGWGAEFDYGGGGHSAITLTDANSVIVIWQDVAHHIHYRRMESGVWQSAVDWIDESADTLSNDVGLNIMVDSSAIPWLVTTLMYPSTAASPFTVNHVVLAQDGDDHAILNGSVRADFGDVRFTELDGNTELDYWLEVLSNGQYAHLWVEFDTIPISPGSNTFYIYYDNAVQTTTSDIKATAVIGDDWEDGVLDLALWDDINGGGTVVEGGGVLQVIQVAGVRGELRSDITYPIGYESRMRVRMPFYGPLFGAAINGLDDYSDRWQQHTAGDAPAAWRLTSEDEGVSSQDDFGTGDVNYHTWVHRLYSGHLIVILDGCQELDKVINIPDEPMKMWALSPQNNGEFIESDWWFVRKYVTPEPTFGAWGSEESPNVVGIADKSSNMGAKMIAGKLI